ncbi:MAG TPA: TonB-dependent receptor [Sphingobium sp.]|nr:TonB-dependent receptor [Sphingobium sp.]
MTTRGSFTRLSCALGGSLLALAVGTAAHAQDASQSDEIVVTAQFRAQNLQDTPIAITAVTGAMLEARSQTDLTAVANQAPSVTLKAQSSTFGPALGANIRGVGQFDPSPAVEPGVGIYVDDVYYASLTGSVLDLLDLDRVEILRGPQGTLAGRNSIGGAIKLYSKRPQGDGSGFLQATYGSRNRIELRGSADFALASSLFMRIAGVSKNQDGYVTRLDFGCVNPPGSANNPAVGGVEPTIANLGNCELGKDGSVDTQALRAQLRFDNGGPVEINIAADYTKENRTPPGEILTYANNASPWIRGNSPAVPLDSRFLCGRYCNYASYYMPGGPWTGPAATGFPIAESKYDPVSQFEGWGVSGQVEWEIADKLQLTSISAYRAFNTHFFSDTDLTPLAANGTRGDSDFWSFSQELRLNGELGDGLVEYTLGGYYIDQRTMSTLLVEIRYVPWPGQFQQNDPVNANSKAAFGQILVHPTEALTLIGGLRYTKEHKDYQFYRRTVSGAPHPFLPFDGEVGNYDGNRVDYRLGLQYQLSDDIMAYGQVSTGFKGGGINPRPFTAFQVVPFDPETLTSYELGLKTDLLDRRLRLNVAAFISDYDNIQLTLLSCPQYSDPSTTDDDFGPCAANANAGDGRIKGFEVEATLRPTTGLVIDGALSYLDFHYKRINPAAGGPGNPNGPQLNNTMPYTPKWKWSVGIQYEMDLGSAGSLTPRFDASYQDVTFSNPGNTLLERIPAYTLANARLTWRNGAGDLEVAGEVTNLFGKYYYITAYDSAGAGFATAQPGSPRQWALSVKKRF